MSVHTQRLIQLLQKEGFVPPTPPPQGMPPGAPPADPNAGMPPQGDPAAAGAPVDPATGMPMDPAMAQQMPADPAAMPPPGDPAAMGGAPVDPATGMPMDPNAMPADPNAQPPVPTLAEIPVDQFMAMMQDMMTAGKAPEGPADDGKKESVADLSKRMENLEGMLSQLLQASGMMPPEQGAAPMAPPMPPPDATQKTAALAELKNKNAVKNATLAGKLRKLGGVVR